MLTTLDTSRSFGGLRAVHKISLEVPRGSVTGIIGPNGAGKSSLMNLISGFIAPDEGKITVDGHDITALRPNEVCRRGVARTFQNLQMFSDMTVLEVAMTGYQRQLTASVWTSLLSLPASRREEREAEQMAQQFLQRLEIDAAYWPRRAGDLPYGLQRRVEIARALATGPNYLLLDEPVAGLNDNETAALGQTLAELSSADLGIVLIEHDIELVMAVCRVIYVMDAGKLIASGSPEEIRANPAVVAAYLGEDADVH